MSSLKARDVLFDPVFNKNPIGLLVLGICSALAVTSKMETALVMSISVIVVVAASNALVSMIRGFLSPSIRIFAQITVIASLAGAAVAFRTYRQKILAFFGRGDQSAEASEDATRDE